MANPYEWSDEERSRARRYDLSEDEARRAERRAEQERHWDRGGREDRRGADYRAGWYGGSRAAQERMWGRGGLEERGGAKDDEAFYERYDEPHAYRRLGERLRAEPRERLERDNRDRDFEQNARHAGRKVARGWRHFTERLSHAFDEDNPGAYSDDPHRAGGMFGGEDRPGSLFSHRDGLGARPLGPNSGKGPKGYVRADNRILEDVCDRLADDGRLDACDIEVKVDAGEVTLNGQVKAREDKRRAEDIAESVSGVKHLQNNLRVRPPEQPAAQRPAAQQPSPSQPTAKRAAAAKSTARPAIQPVAPTSAQITGPSTKAAAPKPAPKPSAPKTPAPRPH